MTDNTKPIPIKDILTDADHPMHVEVKGLVDKLERGEVSMCGCMGPMYGEPHCYCSMVRLGLPLSPEREAANAAANKRLSALFEPGGFFARKSEEEN